MTAIVFHLGVHKTATTHLQKYWASCNRLTDAVHCPPLDEMRANFTRVLARSPGAAAAWIEAACDGRDRLVLSDENLIGTCEGNLESAALYPRAATNLRALASIVGERRIDVLLCVRDYADYLRSAWCESIRHVPYRPFRAMYRPFDLAARGWEHVAADVLAALPGATVTCWTHEDLPRVRGPLTAGLFEVDEARLPAPDEKRERRSFSRMAIRLMDDVHERLGSPAATELRASVEKVVNGPQMPRFDPWTPDEMRRLAGAYEASLAALRALPRVRMA